jgi:hypothetical protein
MGCSSISRLKVGHGVKHNTHNNLLALRKRVADPKLTGYDPSIR